MSSLVSDFIIEPVLRQARRFSSGFGAPEPAPIPTFQRPSEFDSDTNSEINALFETDEEDHTLPGRVRMESSATHALPNAASTSDSLSGGRDGDHAPMSLSTNSDTQTPIESEIRRGDVRSRAGPIPAELRNIPRQPRTLPALTSISQASAIGGGVSETGLMEISDTQTSDADRVATRLLVLQLPDRPLSVQPPRTLPEDDGMRILRKRILSIQSRAISPSEKARLMHLLLSEGYTKSRLLTSDQEPVTTRRDVVLGGSPSSPTSNVLASSPSERQGLSGRLQSLKETWYPSAPSRGALSNNPLMLDLPLTADDLTPTFAPPIPRKPREDSGNTAEAVDEDEEDKEDDVAATQRFGCQHYARNVKMQCATCEKWYTCRFCHDEAETHTLPRKETRHMLCMFCGCAQNVSDTCVQCARPAAQYFCGICKLWSDDPNKPVYHCHDCGLCRVGQGLGKDFIHCQKCNACLDIRIADSHKCIERSTDCNCPICGDYLFSSVRQVWFMKCGHSIHRDCYHQHMRTSYRCPLCSKSCVNMATQFRNLDIAIAAQPMPEEYRTTVAVVSCNDCSAKSHTPYHWLGLKCGVCQSYNTIQQQLLATPAEASAAILPANANLIELPAPVPPESLVRGAASFPNQQFPEDSGDRRGSSLLNVPPRIERRFSPAWLLRSEMLRLPSLPRFRSLGGQFTTEAAGFGMPAAASESGGGEATVSDEEEDYDDDEYDFWGMDEIRNLTSAESAEGHGSEGDSDEDDNDSDICDDEDDDDNEEEEISLFGHV